MVCDCLTQMGTREQRRGTLYLSKTPLPISWVSLKKNGEDEAVKRERINWVCICLCVSWCLYLGEWHFLFVWVFVNVYVYVVGGILYFFVKASVCECVYSGVFFFSDYVCLPVSKCVFVSLFVPVSVSRSKCVNRGVYVVQWLIVKLFI